MLNLYEVMETNKMIDHDLLDVRTITMGISLLDCAGTDLQEVNDKIYAKILKYAGKLVETGEAISRDFGIPIVNKRVSVTPIALVGAAACRSPEDFVTIAKTLDKAAKEIGVPCCPGIANGPVGVWRCHSNVVGDFAARRSTTSTASGKVLRK